MVNKMRYLALIGDIVDSKVLKNRSHTQQQLEAVCRQLNNGKRAPLVSPFTVTLGDEFQALFSGPASLWQSIFTIEAHMHPVALRFGMGIGDISTRINTESAIGMDGPAFYLAREAIDNLKKDNMCYGIKGFREHETLLEHTLNLITHERLSWNKNRLDILSLLLGQEKVSDIAKALAISEQAVYKNIRDGHLETIMGIFTGLDEAIQDALS